MCGFCLPGPVLLHPQPTAAPGPEASPLPPPPPPVSEGAWAPRPACGARPASTHGSTSTFWLLGCAHEAPGCSFSLPAPWVCYLCSSDVTCAPGMPPSPNHVQPNPDRCATFPAALLERAHPAFSLTRNAFCIPSFNASILVISLSPPCHCATVEVLSLCYDQDAASLPLNHTHIHFQGDKGDSALPWP